MTEKKKRFAEEYMRTGDSQKAYISAGYSSNENSLKCNASRLLNSPEVQKYIQTISEQIKSSKIADIEEMQIRLTNIIRGMTTEEVIITELIGNGKSKAKVINKHPSIKEVLKACDLMLRCLGAYTERVQIDGVVPVVISGSDDLEE